MHAQREVTSKEKGFHASTVSFLFISQESVSNSAAQTPEPSYEVIVMVCANFQGFDLYSDGQSSQGR